MGVCSAACEPARSNCPSWMECIPVLFSAAMGMCMMSCEYDDMCREGWSCQAFPLTPLTTGSEATYVCWMTGINMRAKGLGENCDVGQDCLSTACEADPLDQIKKCTAPCGSRQCLGTYFCRTLVNCLGPACDFCFPGPL